MKFPGFSLVLALWIALLMMPGCGDDEDSPNQPPDGTVAADFTLLDVNANSGTFEQGVSPRQFEGKISAWYFGAAT